jgi:hypothetical protein
MTKGDCHRLTCHITYRDEVAADVADDEVDDAVLTWQPCGTVVAATWGLVAAMWCQRGVHVALTCR